MWNVSDSGLFVEWRSMLDSGQTVFSDVERVGQDLRQTVISDAERVGQDFRQTVINYAERFGQQPVRWLAVSSRLRTDCDQRCGIRG